MHLKMGVHFLQIHIDLRQSMYYRTFNIIDFTPFFVVNIEERNITWITLYFEGRILNFYNNRLNFVVFAVTDENKTKKHRRVGAIAMVVHLSCPTGSGPWTGGHCSVHHPIPQ